MKKSKAPLAKEGRMEKPKKVTKTHPNKNKSITKKNARKRSEDKEDSEEEEEDDEEDVDDDEDEEGQDEENEDEDDESEEENDDEGSEEASEEEEEESEEENDEESEKKISKKNKKLPKKTEPKVKTKENPSKTGKKPAKHRKILRDSQVKPTTPEIEEADAFRSRPKIPNTPPVRDEVAYDSDSQDFQEPEEQRDSFEQPYNPYLMRMAKNEARMIHNHSHEGSQITSFFPEDQNSSRQTNHLNSRVDNRPVPQSTALQRELMVKPWSIIR